MVAQARRSARAHRPRRTAAKRATRADASNAESPKRHDRRSGHFVLSNASSTVFARSSTTSVLTKHSVSVLRPTSTSAPIDGCRIRRGDSPSSTQATSRSCASTRPAPSDGTSAASSSPPSSVTSCSASSGSPTARGTSTSASSSSALFVAKVEATSSSASRTLSPGGGASSAPTCRGSGAASPSRARFSRLRISRRRCQPCLWIILKSEPGATHVSGTSRHPCPCSFKRGRGGALATVEVRAARVGRLMAWRFVARASTVASDAPGLSRPVALWLRLRISAQFQFD